MKTRSAKNKGKKLQNWVRDTLLSVFNDLEEGDVKSAIMGESGEDIQLSPAARKLIPFSFECKSLARFAFYTHYDQAVGNTPVGMEPVVVAKANRRKPMVILDAEYFFNLIKENKNG